MSDFLNLGIVIFFVFYLIVQAVVFIFRVISSVSKATKSKPSRQNTPSAQNKSNAAPTSRTVPRSTAGQRRNAATKASSIQERMKKELGKMEQSVSGRNAGTQEKKAAIRKNRASLMSKEGKNFESFTNQEGRDFETFLSRQGRTGSEGTGSVEGTEFHPRGHRTMKQTIVRKGQMQHDKKKKIQPTKDQQKWLHAFMYKEILDKPRSQRPIR